MQGKEDRSNATFHRSQKPKRRGQEKKSTTGVPHTDNPTRASINLACVQPNRNMNLILNFDQALCNAGLLPISHCRFFRLNLRFGRLTLKRG